MQFINYKRLSNIVANDKPFRGTDNEYPLAKRTHSYKRFIVEKDAEGNVEYHIKYGCLWDNVEITKERYKELNSIPNHWGHTSVRQGDGSIKYFESKALNHIIGVVRKDNTFEFTTRILHQGSRGFVGVVLDGEVVSSVKHGGTIYREANYMWNSSFGSNNRETLKIIPIFKGQRLDLNTLTSVINYEVHAPFINRAKAKGVMAEFLDALKFNEVMFKTMTKEVLVDGLTEAFKEAYGGMAEDQYNWHHSTAIGHLEAYAKNNMKTDMYKTVLALMTAHHAVAWAIGSGNTYYVNRNLDPYEMYTYTRKKLERQIKIENDALDVKVYKANEVYPSNTWDIKVIVNGEQVKTY
jgi:hypothetical protein